MKLCKKLLAILLTASLLLTVSSGVLAKTESRTPEVPDGYDGLVVISVEALPLGIDYLLIPQYVPYHAGESVAELTARVLDEYGLNYEAGDIDSFYLTAIEWPYLSDVSINVPDYLMEQLIENYCYDEEDGWDQDEPVDNMLAAGCYTYYSGWMIADNDVLTDVGASEVTVEEGHVYRWMYTIYGYGMDIGMSDGWGMFPPFENPAMGVERSEAYILLAEILTEPDAMDLILSDPDVYDCYMAFYNAIAYLGSTQEEIDAAADALLEALLSGPEVLMGDVDLDGDITVTDALLVLRAAMGLIELEGDAAIAADWDDDGNTSVTDALFILREAMGI